MRVQQVAAVEYQGLFLLDVNSRFRLFSLLFQGGTIKAFVEFLHIEKSNPGHKQLHEEVSDHVSS